MYGLIKNANSLLARKIRFPAQFPSLVIGVEDIKKAMEKITSQGEKFWEKPVEIPGFGQYVSFYDTEGNRLSVIEGTEQM